MDSPSSSLRGLQKRVVDLSDAPQDARRATAERTYPLFSTWWPELTFEQYARGYFSPQHRLIRVYTWEDARGELAGLLIGGAVDLDVDADRLTVIRGATCKRAGVRSVAGDVVGGLMRGLAEAALHAHRRGRIPVALAVLSSPRGFELFHNSAPRCYPSHRRSADDPRLRRWYEALRSDAGPRAQGKSPFVTEGVAFDVPDAVRARWEHSRDPAVRFYLEHCPDYGRGQELVAVLPLEISDLLRFPYCLARVTGGRAVRRAQRLLRPHAASV